MFDIVSITETSKNLTYLCTSKRNDLLCLLVQGYVRIFDVLKHGNKCEISYILLEGNPFGIVMY